MPVSKDKFGLLPPSYITTMPIPIVNDNDEIICYKERSEVKKELMRVVVLRIVNEYGETLLVQRAATKKREPNKRTIAVGGGVEQGESYEEAIIRETEEELGIVVKPTFLVKRKSVDEEAINFFQAIFYVQLPKHTPFMFDEHEIQHTKWASKEEIDHLLTTSSDDFIDTFRKYQPIISEKV
jgi:8-oxo-dGTP pyrophosphatase MutT (NUDIX family)